jgi:hypothetical protein
MLFRPTLVISVLPPPEATGLTTVLRDGLNALHVSQQAGATCVSKPAVDDV